MKNEIIVSVIVPVYNAETFLRKTLDCICGQTLRDIEIILVDDGSTDETPAILQEYADRDSRITLLNQEHEYAGAARNKGMAIARGKYYSFLDADDIFDSTMLEKMVARAEEVGADVVVCRCDIFHTEGEYTPLPWQIHDRYLTKLNRKKFSLKNEYPQASFQTFIGWAWDKLFRAEYVKKNGFAFGSTRHGNDGPFVFPAVAGADCISIIDESLVKYRKSDTQISNVSNLSKNPTAGCTSVEHISVALQSMNLPGGVWQSFAMWVAHYMCWNMNKLHPDAQETLRLYIKNTFDAQFNVLPQLKDCAENKSCSDVYQALSKDIRRYRSLVAPAISVVLPIYNAELYLREALSSLLAQSFDDFEAICVNDGSKDNSLKIIYEYAQKDTRIRVLDGPNGGYGKAMNRGMAKVTGKYFAILEPDDVLPRDAYEKLYALAEEHQLDIAKGCVSRFVDNNGKRDFYETTTIPNTFLNRVITPRNEQLSYTINANTWTCLYRMRFLRDYNIEHHESPGASYQDNGLFFLSFSYAERVLCTSHVVYHCRRDNPNSSVHALANKTYAMRDEYAYIRRKLELTPDIWKNVQPIYLRKRFDNHNFTYSHQRDSIKLEYLEDFRKELMTLEDIPRTFLSERSKLMVSLILRSPLLFLMAETFGMPQTQKKAPKPAQSRQENKAPAETSVPNTPKSDNKDTMMRKARIPHKKEFRVMGIPVWSKNTRTGRCIYRLFGIRVRHKKIK